MDIRKKIMREPNRYDLENSTLARYMAYVEEQYEQEIPDYQSLHHWSVENLNDFWTSVWRFNGILSSRAPNFAIRDEKMPGAESFPNARLNFAENLLRTARWPDALERIAIFARCESRDDIVLTYADLLAQVASLQKALKKMGVTVGDRVAGVVCNTHEAIVAMLATTSIGGIWSSASPDFGVNTIHDRFSQIEPKVLFAVNG